MFLPQLYDGSTPNAPVIPITRNGAQPYSPDYLCGGEDEPGELDEAHTALPTDRFLASANQILLIFRADEHTERAGFIAHVVAHL